MSGDARKRRGRRCGSVSGSATAIAWLALLILSIHPAAAHELRICIDQAPWPPNTYLEQGAAAGRHIEHIQAALQRLGWRAQLLPMPWVRCLSEARLGRIDAVATAAYSRERARYLQFPAGAEALGRVTGAVGAPGEVVVLTPSERPFEYRGDPRQLPQPVYVPHGWAMIEDLQAAGLRVERGAPNERSALHMLLRDGQGSAVAVAESVLPLLQLPAFDGRLHVSRERLDSRSYYLPFSRRSPVPRADIERLWATLDEVAAETTQAPAAH